jgi:hypothetical protein
MEPTEQVIAESARSQAVNGPRTISLRWVVSVALCTLLLAALVCLVGAAWSGSMSAFLKRIEGKELVLEYVSPDLTEPGIFQKDEFGRTFIEVPVAVRNVGPTARKLVGAGADCQCVVVGSLPQTIEPGNQGLLQVRVRVQPDDSTIDRAVVLYTDSAVDATLSFHLVDRAARSR